MLSNNATYENHCSLDLMLYDFVCNCMTHCNDVETPAVNKLG